MNKVWFAMVLGLVCAASPEAVRADAGAPCHFHGKKPATEQVVVTCANARRDALVKTGKLHANWAQIKHESVAQVAGPKGAEWKVRYQNPGATDASKQNLFIFFTLPGNFIAANHTGQ